MKTIKNTLLVLSFLFFISCDNNDDSQNNPQNPTDGFTIGNTFHETPNTYITIDQTDRDTNGSPDYYSFFFTDGRMTDTFGVAGIGYAYAYSINTTKLVKLQIFESNNSNLTSGGLTPGGTYIASNIVTTDINGFGIPNTGFSKDSFVSYNLQTGSVFGTENGFDFSGIPEAIGVWHYPNNTNPTITINAINIDSTTPANSTIDVDYTFIDTSGNTITGHYQGTLGVILD